MHGAAGTVTLITAKVPGAAPMEGRPGSQGALSKSSGCFRTGLVMARTSGKPARGRLQEGAAASRKLAQTSSF